MTPVLDAADRIRLDTCHLDRDRLVDDLTGERYDLNPAAVSLLRACDGRRTAGEVSRSHANARGVDPGRVLADLATFVEPLRAAGLVRVRRRWRRRILGLVLDAGAGRPEVAGTPGRRRFAPTAGGWARAVLHAGRLALACGVVATTAAALALAAFAPGAGLAVGLLPLAVVAAALATVAGHEAAHLLAVPRVGGRAAFVGATRNQVAVAHDVTEPRRRALVAVAGPGAGAAVAIVAGPALGALPSPAGELGGPTAALLAAGHLAGLLPWFADGRHLWAAWR